jgi:hypothetical protein
MQTNNFYKQEWEYLLVISPPEDVKRSIGKIKKEVSIKYGCPHALHSAAYISLVRFLLVKNYEANLLFRLFSFCINKIPFEIMLKNFEVFPRHTLYADVTDYGGLNKLQNELIFLLTSQVSAREKFIRANKKHHMTIAGNLNPIQFESIADEYRNRQINTTFEAKSIVMFKKPYKSNSGSFRRYGRHNFVLGCC